LNRRRFAANNVWSSSRFDPRTVFQRRRSNQSFIPSRRIVQLVIERAAERLAGARAERSSGHD